MLPRSVKETPLKPANAILEQTGTTIFTLMSALAAEHGAINLGQGFPDTEGPADVIAAAAAALGDQRNQYPPLTGVVELREAVAAANHRFYGLQIDPVAGVVVTSGATEAITACLMALLNPGDEVVLIEPLYDTYLPVVKLLGGIPRLVRLSPPHWALPREELAAAFSPRTKLLLLNSPQNPTGKVFTADELGFIADLLTRHDAYAVCDEVYEHLVFAPARHIPLMTLPGMAARSLRIGSAGKTFALTGWKVGYASGPPALISLVAKAHQNLTFTTPPNLQRGPGGAWLWRAAGRWLLFHHRGFYRARFCRHRRAVLRGDDARGPGRRHPGLGLLCRRCPGRFRALCLLQAARRAAGGAGQAGGLGGARTSDP
jgi:N-succinyldiaminopimelate aminotransferase